MTGRISADSDSSSVTVSPHVGPDNSPPPPDLHSLGGCVPALLPSDLLPLQLLPPSGYAGWKDRWFSDHSQLLLSRDSGGTWEGNTAWYFLLSSDGANCHLVILPSFQGGIFLLHYNIWWLFLFSGKCCFIQTSTYDTFLTARPPVKCKTNYSKLLTAYSSVNYLSFTLNQHYVHLSFQVDRNRLGISSLWVIA